MVNQLEMLYEGKAKKIYATDKDDMVIVHYKDDATAFNGQLRNYQLVGVNYLKALSNLGFGGIYLQYLSLSYCL